MSNATLESCAVEAVEERQLADAIRRAVRTAVEAALAKVPGNVDTRREGRAAAFRAMAGIR